MKKNLFWLFALVLSVSATFTACEEDLCKDVDCGANGTCFEGSCSCNQGYEGTNCETKWITKYVNIYNVKDTCVLPATSTLPEETVYDSYDQEVVAGADDFKLTIKNFINSGNGIAAATILTATGFEFVNQAVTVGGSNYIVNGTGTYLADGKIRIVYTAKFASSGNKAFDCKGVMTKK